MNNRRLPILNETLYSINVGNSARRSEQVITHCKVTKVGRKYFEITFEDHWRPVVFHIDNWHEKTDYSSDFCLYENPQQWEDEKESIKLRKIILKEVEYNRDVTLQQMRDIMKIINPQHSESV